MNKNIKHLIYQSEIDIKDWVSDREEIMDDSLDCCDCKKKECEKCRPFWEACHELNSSYLGDEIDNLNIKLKNVVVAFAVVGRWDGEKQGYKILSKNVNSIFSVAEDDNVYFSDGRNIKAYCTHHDGVNKVTFRVLKDDVDIEKFKRIMNKYMCCLPAAQVSTYTKSLAPYVHKVFGW